VYAGDENISVKLVMQNSAYLQEFGILLKKYTKGIRVAKKLTESDGLEQARRQLKACLRVATNFLPENCQTGPGREK
jgi:hypothetical protein